MLTVMLTIIITSNSLIVSGYQYIPYNSYNYNEWNEAVSSAPGYYPTRYIMSDAAKTVTFGKPVDLNIDEEGNFYILNAKSLDVVILDRNLQLKSHITEFSMPDGSKLALVEPSGLFVKNDLIYIADTGLGKVLICDMNGEVQKVLEKPTSAIYPQEKTFEPQKVLVDSLGNIYVLVKGVYQGAVCFNSKGEFLEFYGNNTVVATANVLLQRFWRMFMTEKQIDGTNNIVPVEYTNFDVDKDGFIFSCTATGTENINQIRKLNPLSNNILKSRQYGDLEYNYYKGTAYITAFVDVTVNETGFVYGLDSTRGRIFTYDKDGEEVFIFGGSGNQLGCFQTVTALDTFGTNVYVLDSTKNTITEFSLTEYGLSVYNATQLYMEGKYTESQQMWEKVLMQNANYSLAYVGIGKAKYYLGDYKSAMDYFERGSNRNQESRTFMELRKLLMRRYLSLILLISIFLIVALIIWKYYKKGKVVST